MKKLLLSLLLAFVFTIISTAQDAQAYSYHGGGGSSENGWVLGLDGLYYFYTQQTSSTTITNTREVINPNLGYHFNMLYIGAAYDYDAFIQAQTNQPTLTSSFRSWGAAVGLMTDNVYLRFTYFFSSIGTLNAGGNPGTSQDLTNGSGYQIELGYMFDLGSNFKLGPDLTYKILTYNTISYASGSETWTMFLPHLNIEYHF